MSSEVEATQDIVDEMMKRYPEKVARDRRKHVVVRNCSTDQHIEADTKVVPGIMTNRGCAFAGGKGVVMGPIKDMVHIVHGPIGCGYYTWGTRRSMGKAENGGDNYLQPKFDSFHSLMKRMSSLSAQFFRFFVRKTYLTV